MVWMGKFGLIGFDLFGLFKVVFMYKVIIRSSSYVW